MYSKHESALLKKKFWTSLGLYMRPVRNSVGERVNWLNYKTGIRHIYFRMDASTSRASIAIEIRHPEKTSQKKYFEKLKTMDTVFNAVTGESWDWSGNYLDEEGVNICRISKEIQDVNILNEADWPAIISFLKPRLLALDEFWEQVKDGLSGTAS